MAILPTKQQRTTRPRDVVTSQPRTRRLAGGRRSTDCNVASTVRTYLTVAPAALLTLIVGCRAAPPSFVVERDPAVPAVGNARWVSIGSPATPPPGEYRFARVRADGLVEARELFTFNGPGPWLAYVGRVQVTPSVVREAFAALDATAPDWAHADGAMPCVLAFESRSGVTWQGCAYPAVAAQLLSKVPRLTAPGPVSCDSRVCQVRILREGPERRHERRAVERDIVLDWAGRFWCAMADPAVRGQAHTLRVERARIVPHDARRVFEWLTGDGELTPGKPTSSPEADRVMVRRRGAEWSTLDTSDGAAVRDRWEQLEHALPASCRLSR